MNGLQNVKLHLVDSIDEVFKLATWLGERRPRDVLAFDTETTGLVVGVDRVRLVQVGDGEHGWAIPWERWGGVFSDIVKKWPHIWEAHNAKYDVGMLQCEGVDMPRDRVRDTRIMHHVLYPHYSTALKNIATRLIDARAAGLQTELKGTSWTWATVPIDYQPYWSYAALDTVLTWKVGELLWPDVESTCPKAFELENEVSWVIQRMERYGAHVNVSFAQQKMKEFQEYCASVDAWCKTEYNVRPGSNVEVIRALQNEGFEFTKATASGAVALDKEVLGSINHPLAEAVLQRRQLQKLATTYLSHFVTEVDADDCIHPSINVLGARTSRMSMERPNLQNLPRKSEHNKAAESIRSCITAREGHKMLMCDFDQIEMRMLASLANETAMIDAFRGPTDFFVALARLVYGDDTIEKKDPRRQIIKNAGYATIYGAGVPKFSRTAGITEERGQWVRDRWNTLFPGVLQFQQRVQSVAIERRVSEGTPYVRCPLTNRMQVAEPGKEYALVNFLIQGAAAAVLKTKLLELDAAGMGEWMVVPVHDEIIMDVPLDHVDDAAETLKRVMNDTTTFAVPLTASVSWGKSWGTKEAYE